MKRIIQQSYQRRFPWQGVVFFVCCLVVAGVAVWLGMLFFSRGTAVQATAPLVSERTEVRRFLDGVWVAPADANLLSIGIMIENIDESRPPSGLARAQLVFEAPVEAGITRFLALYGTPDARSEIGPVRSLRPYYLDWAKELGAVVAHVGGSNEALRRVQREYPRLNVDQFFEAGSFWRTKARHAPHNVYTTVALLRDLMLTRGVNEMPTATSWEFVDERPLAERPEGPSDLTLAFSTAPYTVTWKYDRISNLYTRWYKTVPHADSDGTAIATKNIVVIPTPVKILDDIGRRAITLSGRGKALVFREGERIEATWIREGTDDRLHFLTADGASLPLTAGTTWVEVFPTTGKMMYNDEPLTFNK